MSNQVPVELRIKVSDAGASSAIDKVAKHVEKITRDAEQRVNQSNNKQRQSYERLSLAREQLGMRSESKIREEMRKTVNAYQELRKSGTASQDELTRAAEKTRQKITRLTNEMGKLTAEQQKAAKAAKDFETAQGRIRGVVAGTAGLIAGTYTLKQPVMNAMSFDERLALEANTGYAEYNYAGKKMGEDAMRAAIVEAVKNGMTKDSALDALHTLISGNQVGGTQGAIDLLPFIAKVSSGQGAAGEDVSNLLTTLMGSGYAKNLDQAKRMVEQGVGAGKAGQFEMVDMARYLPELLPDAKNAGLTGQAGYEKLLVWLQQARGKAGTSQEAANNVKNALAKLQSDDTAKAFDDAGRGDLGKMLMMKAAQGIDPATAWQQVIQSEIDKNPNLKPAMAKLKSAKSVADQDAAIESIKSMAGGQGLATFFRDMQAKSGMISLLDVDFGKQVAESIAQAVRDGAVNSDFGYMETKSGFKVRRAGELKDLGEYAAADRLTPIIGDLADKFSDLSAKYPELTGGTTLATSGITAVASAAGFTALALGTSGGAGGLAGAATMTASKLVSAAGVISAAVAGFEFGSTVVKPAVDKAVQYFSDAPDATLSTFAYDVVESAKNLVHVVIEPKDMGYLARVDKQKSRGVASHEVKSNTGNIRTGAPGSP
ncbi:phage tail tape measure protein [Methylomonas rapida]|uniref:Phage tail tape measure protein n=1 Tax=Methylomonas rapida TaxID=2963939 RepID=A0ABY7GE85_9GAMM|nr:phage tail tape measure protein [Methylomonas rapida]WAR43597.1 phage tail tape measure protein [Methylomonas rapida]